MSLSRKIGGRPLLLAGFGSLLLLMVLAGGYPLRTLEQVRRSDLAERDNYLQRDRALDRIQTGFYQSAIIMRDFLLALGEKSAAGQIERFTQSREQTDQALADCAVPGAWPGLGRYGGAGTSSGRRVPCSFHSGDRDQSGGGVASCKLKLT